MRTAFFRRTAWNNIKKNYRFFIPEILTGAGLLACFYIVYTLTVDKRLLIVAGGDYIPLFMTIGTAVIAVLSAILILYANSFLMRQRKREYGLYNVLGMEKKHVGRILLHECLISAAFSLLLGMGAGMLFYKLCSLLICRLLKSDIVLGFGFVSVKPVAVSLLYFAGLYAVSFLLNLRTLKKMKPVELLAGKNTGEREPKLKLAVFFIGAAALFSGYYIAVAVMSPLEAILMFFAAVFLVIIGTYCLFTAGSVFVLKCLKKNKRFYYTKKHMAPVAGLLFRMKQNAVGLASVAILSTGVLVMASTTAALYGGMQTAIEKNYPDDVYLMAAYETAGGGELALPAETLSCALREAAAETGIALERVSEEEHLEAAYLFSGSELIASADYRQSSLGGLVAAEFITEETYGRLTGETLGLGENEIAYKVLSVTGLKTPSLSDAVRIGGEEFSVAAELALYPVHGGAAVSAADSFGIVVKDGAVLERIYGNQKAAYGENASGMTVIVSARYADRAESEKKTRAFEKAARDNVRRLMERQPDYSGDAWVRADFRADAEEAVVGMYGSLLFLGIILGIVCLFATVLIIYYKQISEGYEDRERYQIMKKVGMSDGEVRAAIRSETLLVFFLPLATAGVHTAFAFPILNKLLLLLMLPDPRIFMISTLIAYAVFAVVYVAIYSMTAKTYYKIVR